MKKTSLFALGAVIVLTAFISGCATSLQPLATQETRTDVVDVEGSWVVEESTLAACRKEATLRIQRQTIGTYDLQVTQDGKTTGWDCETLTLNKTMFIDIFPQKTEQDDTHERVLQIGTHAFFILRRDATSLSLVGFDHAKLDKAALDEKLAVPSPRNERLVFIADTERLQKFFAKHGGECAQSFPMLVLKRRAVPKSDSQKAP